MGLRVAGINKFASFKAGLNSIKAVHKWSLRWATYEELSDAALILQLAVTSSYTQQDTLALLK